MEPQAGGTHRDGTRHSGAGQCEPTSQQRRFAYRATLFHWRSCTIPARMYCAGSRKFRDEPLRCLSAGLNCDNQIKRPAARTKSGLVEAPGVEPGSEDRPHNGSTCVADRFHFAATHAHRLA